MFLIFEKHGVGICRLAFRGGGRGREEREDDNVAHG